MTIGNINVESTIKNIQAEINRDKSLSPGLINSINLLIMIINLLVQRLGLTSNNSSLPQSSNKRKKRTTEAKKKKSDKTPGGQEGHEGSTLEQFDDPDEIIETQY